MGWLRPLSHETILIVTGKIVLPVAHSRLWELSHDTITGREPCCAREHSLQHTVVVPCPCVSGVQHPMRAFTWDYFSRLLASVAWGCVRNDGRGDWDWHWTANFFWCKRGLFCGTRQRTYTKTGMLQRMHGKKFVWNWNLTLKNWRTERKIHLVSSFIR